MAGATTRGKHTSLLTRRNKCVMISLIGTLVLLIMLMNAGLFSNAPVYSGELCKLEDVELQYDFDPEAFSGSWYGSFTKGMDNSLVATLLEFSDVKVNFHLRGDGKFDISSVGGKFYGMWCPVGFGHGEAPDPNHPQKMSVLFDTPTGKKFGSKPVWIVKTDYKNFAVIYSCWEQNEDGYCKAKGAYAVVLQRKKTALPPEMMEEVEAALSRSCINPKAIRPIKHKEHCKSEQKEIMATPPPE